MTDACRESVERQLAEARAGRGSASVPALEAALADQLGAVARTQFLLGRHPEAAASLARARALRPELGGGSDWAEWIVAQAD